MSAAARAGTSRNLARWYGAGREWATPAQLFARLDREFGFTLDPCATPANAKCRRYFTERDDGLRRPWGRARVFMNPPYGRELEAWVRKARASADRGALVVGLLPVSTELGWWHEHVVDAGAELRFVRGRIRFVAPDGRRVHTFEASVVVIWRPRARRARIGPSLRAAA